MFTVDVDVKLRAELEAIALRVPLAVDAGLKGVGEAARAVATAKVGKIYLRPIPRRKNGTPMWARSGDLFAQIKQPLKVTKTSVTIGVDAKYRHREALGVEWNPKRPGLGVIRKNPFIREALAEIESNPNEIFAKEFEKALGI